MTQLIRKVMWDTAIELLGERQRSLLGRAVKEHGSGKVIEVLMSIQEHPPADPVSYFQAALRQKQEKRW